MRRFLTSTSSSESESRRLDSARRHGVRSNIFGFACLTNGRRLLLPCSIAQQAVTSRAQHQSEEHRITSGEIECSRGSSQKKLTQTAQLVTRANSLRIACTPLEWTQYSNETQSQDLVLGSQKSYFFFSFSSVRQFPALSAQRTALKLHSQLEKGTWFSCSPRRCLTPSQLQADTTRQGEVASSP
jgi:hypothetical protein